MKFKQHTAEISHLLSDYQKNVDRQIELYNAALSKHESLCALGKYSQGYLDDVKNETCNPAIFAQAIDTEREKVKPMLIYHLEKIEEEINHTFGGKVSNDFRNKLAAYRENHVELSDREFELLQHEAKTYPEMRILEQFALDRGHYENVVEIDKSGNVTGKNEFVKHGFAVKMPNMEKTYTNFNQYKNKTLQTVDYYCGVEPIKELLGKPAEVYQYCVGNDYTKQKCESKINDVLTETFSFLPENKIKRVLTENDKKVIDILIDPNYPNLARDTVKKLAEASPEMRELFELDDRYSQYC